jgi:hypothetical protein
VDLVHGFGVEGVAHLRPVHGEGGDAAVDAEEEIAIGHVLDSHDPGS